MERVGWHPVGLYEKRHHRFTTFCYSLIIIAFIAGIVAVVISWLLATGIIDPDRKVTNYKESRKLDIFRDTNTLAADIKNVEVQEEEDFEARIEVDEETSSVLIKKMVEAITEKSKILVTTEIENETTTQINDVVTTTEEVLEITESLTSINVQELEYVTGISKSKEVTELFTTPSSVTESLTTAA